MVIYRLVRLLGSGGFASVYLAQHIRIDSLQVAIKVLHLTNVDVNKFQQEAETMATLAHPHVVRLLDFAVQQGVPFLVIEYAPVVRCFPAISEVHSYHLLRLYSMSKRLLMR